MSLTVYIYKVKKGNKPTCKNGTEWTSCRRAYMTFAICQDMAEIVENKKGIKLYQLSREVINRICCHRTDPEHSYDDLCEHDLMNWLYKRKFDFDKYDYYLLNA